jgi:hypothetical protein
LKARRRSRRERGYGVKRVFSLWVVVTVLAVVPVASAGSSLLGAYGSESAKPVVAVKGTTLASGPTNAAAGTEGQLPFTGVDLATLVGAGVLLLGVGFGVRRLAGAKE